MTLLQVMVYALGTKVAARVTPTPSAGMVKVSTPAANAVPFTVMLSNLYPAVGFAVIVIFFPAVC